MIDQNRAKAIIALAKAKAIPRKTVYVPKGVTGEIMTGTPIQHGGRRTPRRQIDHEAVLARIKEGANHSQVAKEFKITRQSVIYIKKKYDTRN